MNPLPADGSVPESFGASALSGASPGTHDAFSNRRKNGSGSTAYPFLLLLSTCVAGVFCYLYLTKPVIMEAAPATPVATPIAVEEKPLAAAPPAPVPTPVLQAPVEKPVSSTSLALAPSSQKLPGDVVPSTAAPRKAMGKTGTNGFEETNLRIQHVLIAEAPGGARNRLEFEVPVLYRSRNLRWSTTEVAQARELLGKLADYQEKNRTLRAEGLVLLDAWNHLINRSIPGGVLRADSPSLPTNQDEANGSPQPSALDTTEAIRLNPAGQ
jgi:hypothetical protein